MKSSDSHSYDRAGPMDRPRTATRKEKRLFQAVVALGALIPLGVGTAGALAGPSFLMAADDWPVELDSHFRFLSGIFLAVGAMFYASLLDIERRTLLFRIAAGLIFTGGLARLYSLVVAGSPEAPHLAGLVMELVVVPMLALWQTRIARRR